MLSEIQVPVLIAGGGPVGMTLALFLARYGVRSMLIERNPSTTRHPKMDLTNGRSMELFRQLGLVEKMRDAGVPRTSPFDVTWFTSLAGYELHRFRYPSAAEMEEIIARDNDGRHPREAPLRVSQIVIEPVLKQALDAEPLVEVHFNTAFERIIARNDDGLTVEICDQVTGQTQAVHCAYLAGCDGGGSRVRRQLGIDLDGEMAVAGAYMVHFRSDARELLQRGGISWHLQTGAGTIIAQNDKDIWTLQRWLMPGDDPAMMTPERVLEEWAGCSFPYEILQANPWTANFVVAQRYIDGRVVLAGDSAHQFVPTGGYGMNSGVADAAGLAWMLAALVQGWGGANLLPAYDAERRPTAWNHLNAARRHMGVRIQIGQVYAEAGNLEAEGCDARRAKVGAQIAALGNAENESWGVELGYRYDESPLIAKEPDAPEIDPLTYRPNTWPGARLPHVFLRDSVSVHDLLGTFFTLLVLDDTDTASFEAAAKTLEVPLKVISLNRPDLRMIYERNFVLVRPDQHVAWRSDILPPNPAGILAKAVGR
jgi:2-polyprenyl-6-methoxyphenol hydroxylase-like FAD-dependent oxidoreductase